MAASINSSTDHSRFVTSASIAGIENHFGQFSTRRAKGSGSLHVRESAGLRSADRRDEKNYECSMNELVASDEYSGHTLREKALNSLTESNRARPRAQSESDYESSGRGFKSLMAHQNQPQRTEQISQSTRSTNSSSKAALCNDCARRIQTKEKPARCTAFKMRHVIQRTETGLTESSGAIPVPICRRRSARG